MFWLIPALVVGGAVFGFWGTFYGLISTGLSGLVHVFNPGVAIPWWITALVALAVIIVILFFAAKAMWNHPFATLFVAIFVVVIYFGVLTKIGFNGIDWGRWFASIVPVGAVGFLHIKTTSVDQHSGLACPVCGKTSERVRTLYADPVDDIVEVRCAEHGNRVAVVLEGGEQVG